MTKTPQKVLKNNSPFTDSISRQLFFLLFHSYRDVTIAGEGLQILTYARPSWPLSSEGS